MADSRSDILPPVGEVVHVSGAEGVCSPAIVMAAYPSGTIRARVLYRAPITEAVGARDSEGEYSPAWDAQYFVNPDGTRRVADSWHWRYH